MSDMIERVARAIADADMEDFTEDAERYLTRARAAIYALKNPTPQINSAICAGKRGNDRTLLQLGYERGLDAALSPPPDTESEGKP